MEDYLIKFYKAHGKLFCDVCQKCVLSYFHHNGSFCCPDCEKLITDQTNKLAESICAEIDQEVLLEAGLMDPADAIDHCEKFKKELTDTCNELKEK